MPWGDDNRHRARDHDAQARRLDEEAARLEAEADRLQNQLAAVPSTARSENVAPPLLHSRGDRFVPPPVPLISGHRGNGQAPTSASTRLRDLRDIDEALTKETDPALRRELESQRTMSYLRQANDPTYAELSAAPRYTSGTRAPGIRRLSFLIRTIPIVVLYALLPHIVPALPTAILNPIGPAFATLILAGVIMLTWLGTAVLPRLRNCGLPQFLGLGVFVPVLGLIVGVLCLAMPEKNSGTAA
jgi:hypothetical protein